MPNTAESEDTDDQVVDAPGAPQPVKISAPTPDEDDDEQEEGPPDGGDPAAARAIAENKRGGQPGKPGSRNERRNLWKQNQELRGSLEGVNKSIETLKRDHEQQLSRMRDQILAEVRPQQRQQEGTPAASPLDRAYGEVTASIAAEIKLMRQHDTEKGDYDLSRYNQLIERRDELNLQRGLAKMGLTPQQIQQMQQGGQRRGESDVSAYHAARFERLATEFPWMNGADDDPTTRRATQAVGDYRRTLLRMGRVDNYDTDREAALHIQNQLGLAPRRAPGGNRETQQRRYGAPVGGGEVGPGARRAPREITVAPALLQGTGLTMKQVQAALFARDGQQDDEQ